MCPGDSGIKKDRNSNLVAVGYIVRTHGIRGEIKVIPLSDIPNRYRTLKRVYIHTPSGEIKEYFIKRARATKKGIIVSFDPPISMDEAKGMVKGYIKIPEDEVPRPGKDSYYHFEIIDMDVFTVDNDYLGKIVEILSTGSNDVYVVRRDDEEYLIPAIKDVVKEVDVKEKRMIIIPVEGLF